MVGHEGKGGATAEVWGVYGGYGSDLAVFVVVFIKAVAL